MKSRTFLFITGLFLVFSMIQSCAPKQEMTVWFPPEKGAGKLALVYVKSSNQKNPLNVHMDYALRTMLVNSKTFKLAPQKDSKILQNQLKHFNYAPKIPSYSNEEIAELSYEVQLFKQVNRSSERSVVRLASCNYLAKKRPCSYRSASMENGIQRVRYTLKGTLQLTRKDGSVVIKQPSVSSTYNRSSLHVPDENTIAKGLSNILARNFLKSIAPYQKTIPITYHGDGDSYAISLIQNGAYTAALNRLTGLTKGNEIEAADLYHMGLVFEIQGNTRSALSYYENADSRLNGEKDKVITQAIRRAQKSLGIAN